MNSSHASVSIVVLALVSAFATTACSVEANELQRSRTINDTEAEGTSDDPAAKLKTGDVASNADTFGGSASDTTPVDPAADGKRGFGAQLVPATLSAGLFNVGGGISYSNGAGAYCTFASWPDYVEATGRRDINGVPAFAGLPTQMRNDGACQLNYRPGFFSFGQTFYSNGSAFCACARSSPPARAVHRRPDSPFQGSCGGC